MIEWEPFTPFWLVCLGIPELFMLVKEIPKEKCGMLLLSPRESIEVPALMLPLYFLFNSKNML
jgi:hypothetical protein